MIEYLLILTITVALVMAISKGVGEPIQRYVQNNVIDMVGCMLRVGQFPTKSFGLCQNAINVKMDVKGNLGNNVAGGSGGNGGSSSKAGGSSSDSDSSGDGNDGAGEGSDSDSSTDDGPGRARVRSNAGTGSLNDSGNDSAFGNGPTTRIKVSNDENSGGDQEFSTGKSDANFGDTTVIVRRIKREDGRVGGSFFVERDQTPGADDESPETYQTVSSQKTPRSEFDRAPTGTRFAIPEPKDNRGPSAAKDQEPDFSFLGMIKWIIIIAVLFFIIVFAASQLNSIRKGWTD